MAYEVRVNYVRRLDRNTQERVLGRLRELAEDPFGSSKVLQDAGGRRSSRVGGMRIIFIVDPARNLLEISHIGPRGEIYRHLS